MALHLLWQFLYSLSHHSLQATQSFMKVSKKDGAVSALAIPLQPLSPLLARNTILTKVSKRWRCICSHNSSTASLTTPCTQHKHLRKSQKDGAVSALAIPLQPLSSLPVRNTVNTKVSKRWLWISSRNSSTASLTTPCTQHNHLRKYKKMALHLILQLHSLSYHSLNATQSFEKVKKMALNLLS